MSNMSLYFEKMVEFSWVFRNSGDSLEPLESPKSLESLKNGPLKRAGVLHSRVCILSFGTTFSHVSGYFRGFFLAPQKHDC